MTFLKATKYALFVFLIWIFHIFGEFSTIGDYDPVSIESPDINIYDFTSFMREFFFSGIIALVGIYNIYIDFLKRRS